MSALPPPDPPTDDPPPEPATTDAGLVDRIAVQDRAAFALLFGRYAGRIRAYLIRAGATRSDAEEIAQEVMVLVWRRAPLYRAERASVSTWIYTIARNRRIDLLRRARRPVPDPADPLFVPDAEPDGLAVLTADERDAQVRNGLAGLTPEQRDVLMAAFWEGLSHGEIAARLDIPLGTVKSRIRLAFQHLRGVLGEDLAAGFVDE